MTWEETKRAIDADYARLAKNKGGKLRYLFTNHSFKITFWFRIGSYLKEKGGVCILLRFPVALIYRHYEYKFGIHMPFGTLVGGGLHFPHFGAVNVNNGAYIGRNCTIYQGVTIGSMRGQGTPVIGDNCVLFSGAKVIGRVTLGDYVAVGAGAVVVNNVPNGCVVGGVPAKVLSDKGKETVARYME